MRVPYAPSEYPALLGLAAIAIYGCVPETGQMPAVGALCAGLVVVELITRTPSALTVQALAFVIVFWSGLFGATGRESAIVGALFAFWPLVLVTAAALWPDGRFVPVAARAAIGLVGGVASVAVARTGALQPTIGPALLAVAVAAPPSTWAAWAVRRRWSTAG